MTLPARADNPAPAAQNAASETLPGGTIVTTKQLVQLIKQSDPVLIDVAPAALKPANIGATPWLPPPHRSIVKSVWIPGAGTSPMSPATADFFRQKLVQLTRHDRDRRIVVYCHPDCPLSLNAAKRAIGEGYRRVYWYPEGIETWQEAGLPTAVTRPEGPEAQGTQ